MDLNKVRRIALKVLVTFLEAGAGYWVATGYRLDRAALAAVVGAGLSAVYNVAKHYAYDVNQV